jgi:hypothetical protein
LTIDYKLIFEKHCVESYMVQYKLRATIDLLTMNKNVLHPFIQIILNTSEIIEYEYLIFR